MEGRCQAAEEVGGEAGAVQVTRGEVMYLLDTNTCIDIIRRRPESARRKLKSTGTREVATRLSAPSNSKSAPCARRDETIQD